MQKIKGVTFKTCNKILHMLVHNQLPKDNIKGIAAKLDIEQWRFFECINKLIATNRLERITENGNRWFKVLDSNPLSEEEYLSTKAKKALVKKDQVAIVKRMRPVLDRPFHIVEPVQETIQIAINGPPAAVAEFFKQMGR